MDYERPPWWKEFGADAKEFVENDFYVDDDGLKSTSTTEEVVDLLKSTQAMLATANLRPHKIASKDPGVTSAFPVEDQATWVLRSRSQPC